jgi:hypothetical protein
MRQVSDQNKHKAQKPKDLQVNFNITSKKIIEQ